MRASPTFPNTLLPISALRLSLFVFPIITLATTVDHFEDGIIDNSQWAIGGAALFSGPAYTFSAQEVIAADGYLNLNLQGPATGNTYGGVVWVRTNSDFNTGQNYLLNFRWSAQITSGNWRGYNIGFTDGTDPAADSNPYDFAGIWYADNAKHTTLYQAFSGISGSGQTDLSPTDWSILIDASSYTASLYSGLDLSGALIANKSLDPGAQWHLRFLMEDASYAGAGGTDMNLNLFDYSAKSVPESTGLGVFAELWIFFFIARKFLRWRS